MKTKMTGLSSAGFEKTAHQQWHWQNQGEYSDMKATSTLHRYGRQQGPCVGIKDSAWIEVCGRETWPAHFH